MPNQLIEDDTQQPTTLSPANQLAQYLQDNWAISDPPVSDVVWKSYWMPSALVTIAFKEVTICEPMIVGWHKWAYDSVITLTISAWFEGNGDYPAVITKVRNRIEELVHISPIAIQPYGFSVFRIQEFNDLVDYTKDVSYKDSVADLTIKIWMKQSKTVQPV